MNIHRILMTTDTIGGVWTYALELAKGLEPYGIEVGLAAMGGLPDRGQRYQVKKLSNVTLFASRFKLEWMERPWPDVEAAGKWLLSLEREFQPDLVHLNGFAHGALAWKTPVLVVGHSCVYSWFHAVRGHYPSRNEWGFYHLKTMQGLKMADAVTAPTRDMLNRLKRIYGSFTAVEPIFNAIDPARFKPRRKKNIIMTAGRVWDEAKNIQLLSRIAADLPWPVEVAGETCHPSGGDVLPEEVRCLGRLSSTELRRRMGQASIFVLPAKYEPFGLCALEAALSGCALVLGDIPSQREVWGDAALFVPPDEPVQLKVAILRLIADRDFRRKIADQCAKRAACFTADRMTRNYLDVYRRLLSGCRIPAAAHPGTMPGASREKSFAPVPFRRTSVEM